MFHINWSKTSLWPTNITKDQVWQELQYLEISSGRCFKGLISYHTLPFFAINFYKNGNQYLTLVYMAISICVNFCVSVLQSKLSE